MTLREYADAVKAYLQGLQKLHPAFKELSGFDRQLDEDILLLPGLDNLDDLIYRLSWDRKSPSPWYEHLDPDGKPTWDTTHRTGLNMDFYHRGGLPQKGGITLSISAGAYSPAVPNVVTINFPRRDHPEFAAKYPDFHSYGFLKRLLSFTVNFWRPEAALVRSDSFGDKVDFQDRSDRNDNWNIGWLTYLENPAVAAALPPKIERETLETGGVLITTTRAMASATNPEHVIPALLIRDILRRQGLLQCKVYADPA